MAKSMRDLNALNLLQAERGTRHLFGKDYHWAKFQGVLTLRPGKALEDIPLSEQFETAWQRAWDPR
jgi:hypothetical protein